MRNARKLLLVLLSVLMVMSSFPAAAFAAEANESIGQVFVQIEDTVPQRADIADDPGPSNINVSGRVELYSDDTMMDVIVRFAEQQNLEVLGADQGYISSIGGRAELDRGSNSGWMGTLNDWFTDMGFANYSVANGKLKAGDEIHVMYTTDRGADIGGAFGGTDKTIKSVELSTGELAPEFTSSNHEYSMILPDGIDSIVVTPTASNKQFKVSILLDGKEYERKEAIPVKAGDVITIKCGGEGDESPEVYTIHLTSAGSFLNETSIGLTTVKENGDMGEALSLTLDKGTNTFSGKLAAYTHLKEYNDADFEITLSGLPDGASAVLKDKNGVKISGFEGGKATTGKTKPVAGSGVFSFYVEVTSGGLTEKYKISLDKTYTGKWTKFDFTGVPEFSDENILYGYPEGTLLQADEEGNITGGVGISTDCWNYVMYVTPSVASVKLGNGSQLMRNSGAGYKYFIYLNGEAVAENAPTQMAASIKLVTLKEIPVNDELDFEFIWKNSKDAKQEIHTTFKVIVVKLTPEELTAFIEALPDIDDLTYAEYYAMVHSYKKAYDAYSDEEKAQISEDTLNKLMDSIARVDELKERHDQGLNELIENINSYKDDLTGDNYADYYAAVKEAERQFLALSDAQMAEFKAQSTLYKAYFNAYLTILEQSILDGSSIGKPTNYPDDFMMSANHYNLDLGHEDTYYEAVFREIWTNRTVGSGYESEKGLPWTSPGILEFDIKDDSIFEIKEVESVYVDQGLGGGGTHPAMKYYLVPKKAGTTTFTVTIRDEAGEFLGQIPEIPVHVNSEAESSIENLNDTLTNFNALPYTTKYDNYTYEYGKEGAEFTFKVNGENAKVWVYDYLQYNDDGTPVKTEYIPDDKGNVTVLLKDGYNGIEVNADYEGQNVTQVYSLKGKVIEYVITNLTRPGEGLQKGDTAGIRTIGQPICMHKILRIYNNGDGAAQFNTDMPLQSMVKGDGSNILVQWTGRTYSNIFNYSRIAVPLTDSGTITLTNGILINRGYGSGLGAEGTQGNTGGIADSTGFGFGKLADVTLQVADSDKDVDTGIYDTLASGNGVIKAGESVTISVPTLPIADLKEQYTIRNAYLTFHTDIPGAGKIASEWKADTSTEDIEEVLKSITFTIPKTVKAGEYRIYGGYVDTLYIVGYLDNYGTEYVRQIKDLIITVTAGDIEIAENLIEDIGEVSLEKEEAINKAKAAYEALSEEDQALVSQDSKEKLEAAIEELALLKKEALPAFEDAYKTTGSYLASLLKGNELFGAEWPVIGLARADRTSDFDAAAYYASVVETVKNNGSAKLSNSKSTENSRTILALTAIGKDVTDVAGYNLLEPLSNLDYLKKQGINGPIWALIALDSHDYEIPAATEGTQATRENIISAILEAQLEDGGWDLSAANADPDMTAMAVQALAPYYNSNAEVKAALDKALECLSKLQNQDGGYSSWGTTNSESCSQVLVALTALGIDPVTDARFVKNGNTVIDALLGFYVEGGGFRHTLDGEVNGMATEQGYYALASYARMAGGKTSLYDMSDVTIEKADVVTPIKPAAPDDNGTEGSTPVKTGDESNAMPWAMAAMAAGMGILIFRRRKDEAA